MTLDSGQGSFTPWFRRRSRLAVTTAAALFVAVFAIRWALPEEEAVTALFVFPISLVAMARGLRAGLLAAAVALLLVALGVLVTDATLSTTGWLVRIATLVAVGALLGSAADNLARAEQQRRLSALSAQRQRQAVEINDTLIQGMAAAKWAMEAGQVDAGLATLTDTIVLGQDLVSELIRENDLGWHTFTSETGSSAGLGGDLGSRDTA